MKLNNFKEILIKKADGNENLETLIRFINDEVLADQVIESLEKMAAHKGDKANSAVTSWAGGATNADINMLHDALSHHLSKFAAAHKARPPKISQTQISTKHGSYDAPHVEMDPVAAQHLERAMHLADFASRASKHSLGKMTFDHVPTQAWEMNRTGDITRKDGSGQTKYVDDQQGLKRRLSGENSKFPNHGYLLVDPHASYKHKGKLRGHEGVYPFHEMKINDKYVHIDPDTEAPTEYEEHEFDKHPLFNKHGKHQAWEMPETRREDKHHEDYLSGMDKWHDSEHLNNWLDRHEKMEEENPERYSKRGSEMSAGLEGVRKGSKKESEPVASAESQPQAVESPNDQETAKVKRRTSKPTKAEESEVVNRLMAASKALKANPDDPKLQAAYDEAHAALKRIDE